MATYQRLVAKMFKEQLGKTMKVYIDDMVVKSKKKEDYIGHLKEAFEILRRYGMKLNPGKCTFGITLGKFLGFLVSQRGIEVNPDQIRAIEGISETLTSKKRVQKLTGRITTLSRFISRSSDRCHKFFNVLRKDHELQWNSECVDALIKLKAYLSSPPLLVKADPGECLLVYLAVFEVAIPRAQNIEADGRAKLATSTKNINKENVVTLLHSSIDQVEVHSVKLTWDWRNRIVTYLQVGMLSQDKKEAKKLRIQAARYNLINCDLYKRTFGVPLAKCLGPNQIRRVLEEVHEGHYGAHTGNRALVVVGAYTQIHEQEVIAFIWKNIICRFGIPTEISCDSGPQFVGKKTTEFFEKWHTKRILSTPYHPAGNSQAESSNKVILNILKKKLEGLWPELLLEVLWAYRTIPKTRTSETPYSLLYGTDAVIPVEVGEPSLRYSNESEPSNDESRLQDLNEVEERRDMAHEAPPKPYSYSPIWVFSQSGFLGEVFNEAARGTFEVRSIVHYPACRRDLQAE
uniref:Integrase catalytic domain-containing protein n=1 Tax=Nicotiana tabacum TaxID=4097 RepID=A0A1S3ZJF2_TOBAC|nr:PREDICTED: uncharacterized protein LOC107787450 [Nicotiana tabacum]